MTGISETDHSPGPWVLIGVDGEMSSADLEDGGRLIQAGAAAWEGEPGGPVVTFSQLIRQPDMAWSQRAAQVHGLTRQQVEAAAPADEVDQMFREWLLAHGAVDGHRMVVPVGLNVAAFDMPFFRQALPDSQALMARRAVDLNALLFTFAGWDPNPRTGGARDFAGWKRSMKQAANTILAAGGTQVREHDAGFDAAQALVGWWWLRTQVTDVTSALSSALSDLDAADPVRQVLGAGLLKRLELVPRPVLEELLGLLGPGVNPRRWFGSRPAGLDGSPLELVASGRVPELLDYLRAPAS